MYDTSTARHAKQSAKCHEYETTPTRTAAGTRCKCMPTGKFTIRHWSAGTQPQSHCVHTRHTQRTAILQPLHAWPLIKHTHDIHHRHAHCAKGCCVHACTPSSLVSLCRVTQAYQGITMRAQRSTLWHQQLVTAYATCIECVLHALYSVISPSQPACLPMTLTANSTTPQPRHSPVHTHVCSNAAAALSWTVVPQTQSLQPNQTPQPKPPRTAVKLVLCARRHAVRMLSALKQLPCSVVVTFPNTTAPCGRPCHHRHHTSPSAQSAILHCTCATTHSSCSQYT